MGRASRSQGSRRAPAAQWVRFTEDWNDRLHEAARHQGKTIAGFLRDAAINSIENVEETIRTKKEARAARQRAAPQRPVRGLGLRNWLDERSAERQQQEPPAPPAPLVVVNVPPAGVAAGPGEVRPPARYVGDGPKWSRDRGWEEVIRRLVISIGGDERQAERLVNALMDEVEALESASGGDAPPSRDGDGPSVLEVVRRLT